MPDAMSMSHRPSLFGHLAFAAVSPACRLAAYPKPADSPLPITSVQTPSRFTSHTATSTSAGGGENMFTAAWQVPFFQPTTNEVLTC